MVDWLSWSEVGLLYFAGGFIAISLSLLVPSLSAVQTLLWLNVLTLPYTVYSIYYQAFLAKEFCPLCITVQVILWLEFWVGQTGWGVSSIEGVSLVIFAFTLVSVLWAFIKQPLNRMNQVTPLQRELQKLKFNTEYVEGILSRQSTIPPIFDGMEVITLGNPDASHTLTVVTNPVCRPCAKAHQEVEGLLETTGDVKCNIVFTLPSASAVQIAQRIMGLPTENRVSALHKWFEREDRNIEKWSNSIKNVTETVKAQQQLALHHRWCEIGRIVSTPTIFLNGIELPSLYHINDAVYLCKNLSRQREFLTT